jgi:hypothetical protein
MTTFRYIKAFLLLQGLLLFRNKSPINIHFPTSTGGFLTASGGECGSIFTSPRCGNSFFQRLISLSGCYTDCRMLIYSQLLRKACIEGALSVNIEAYTVDNIINCEHNVLIPSQTAQKRHCLDK